MVFCYPRTLKVKNLFKEKAMSKQGKKIIEQNIRLINEWERNKQHVSVLFADLSGSTVYKQVKPPLEAHTKVYRHNQTV
jgi:hypothetical protein